MRGMYLKLSLFLYMFLFVGVSLSGMDFEDIMLPGGRSSMRNWSSFAQIERMQTDLDRFSNKAEKSRRAFYAAYKKHFDELSASEINALSDAYKRLYDVANSDDLIYRSTSRKFYAMVNGEQLSAGSIIAKTFAGKDFAYFDTSDIKTWDEGLKHGLTIAVARGFAEMVQGRVKGIFERVFGVTIDKLVDAIKDGVTRVYREIFYEGKEPFTNEIITNWQLFITTNFSDLEKVVKDGLKDAYRGHDMATRTASLLDPVDEQTKALKIDDNDASVTAKQTELVDAWNSLMHGYVEQFQRIRFELEIRKGFYDSMSREVFFAGQIQKKLHEFSEVLLQSATLTDLDAAISSNKAVIPAFRNNIDNLFKQLLAEIKPRSYSLTSSNNDSSSPYSRKKKSSYEDDDDYGHSRYPSRMSGG